MSNNSPGWLDRLKVQPKTRIIEVVAGNSNGHSTLAILGRLAHLGSAVYRTDLKGDIAATTDETINNVKTGQASGQCRMLRKL